MIIFKCSFSFAVTSNNNKIENWQNFRRYIFVYPLKWTVPLKGGFLEITSAVPLARVLFAKTTELYNVFMLLRLPYILKYISNLFILISVQIISLETDLLTLRIKIRFFKRRGRRNYKIEGFQNLKIKVETGFRNWKRYIQKKIVPGSSYLDCWQIFVELPATRPLYSSMILRSGSFFLESKLYW